MNYRTKLSLVLALAAVLPLKRPLLLIAAAALFLHGDEMKLFQNGRQ